MKRKGHNTEQIICELRTAEQILKSLLKSQTYAKIGQLPNEIRGQRQRNGSLFS